MLKRLESHRSKRPVAFFCFNTLIFRLVPILGNWEFGKFQKRTEVPDFIFMSK